MIEVTFGDGLALCVLDGIAEALHRLKAATIGVKVGEAAGLVAGEQGHCAGVFRPQLGQRHLHCFDYVASLLREIHVDSETVPRRLSVNPDVVRSIN